MKFNTFFGHKAATLGYHPIADVSSGFWTPSTGVDLYACVDEAAPNNTDWIQSAIDPAADACELRFDTVARPPSSDGHQLSYRIRGDNAVSLEVALYCGAVLVASWLHDPAPAVWTTYLRAISAAAIDASLTDYSDLRLRVTAG